MTNSDFIPTDADRAEALEEINRIFYYDCPFWVAAYKEPKISDKAMHTIRAPLEGPAAPVVPDGYVLVPKKDIPASLYIPLPEGRVIGENQRIESIVCLDEAYQCAAAIKRAMLRAASSNREGE